MSVYRAGAEEFWSLVPEWDQIVVGSPQGVFATPAWHRLWCEAYAAERDLHFFAIREEGRLVAVVPLMWDDGQLHLIGADDVWDYRDLILATDAEAPPAFAALLEAIDAWPWRALVLPGVPYASPSRDAVAHVCSTLGYRHHEELAYVTPKAPLPGDWESYLAQLSKKDRHELRRKLRRLEEAGVVRLETVHGPHSASQDIEDFLRLHRASKTEKAAFMTEDRARFFEAIVREPYAMGSALLFFLTLDGVRVASAVCFDTGRAYLLYNSGFNPVYSQLSVGLLLKALCIKHAVEAGRACFDFLRGSEPYKYDLGGRDEALYCLTVERSS